MEVNETALAAAIADSSENEITADYISKTLNVPDVLKTVGVEGDKDTRRVRYRIRKIPDDWDLSTGSVLIPWTNANGETREYSCTDVKQEKNDLVFSMLIPDGLCVKAGKVEIGLCVRDRTHDWNISPAEFDIGPGLHANESAAIKTPFDLYTKADIDKMLKELPAGGTGTGVDGGYYLPSVSADGVLTWSASKTGMPSIPSESIKGPAGKDGKPGKDGQPGKDGKPGKDGQNYVLTETDKEEIAETIKTSVPLWETKTADITDPEFKGLEPGYFYALGTIADGSTIKVSGDGPEWRWSFETGKTIPSVNYPDDFVFDDSFKLEAERHYEFSAWSEPHLKKIFILSVGWKL